MLGIRAVRALRAPLAIAVAVMAAAMLDAVGVPAALLAARLGIRLLLASYLLAGLLNIPSFPRTLRGPATTRPADRALLDMWTVIATSVAVAVAAAGTVRGLL